MPSFDQVWIENRFRQRKKMSGKGLTLNTEYGFLEAAKQRGFNAEKKRTFLDRWKVCNNQRQIVKSLGIDIQSLYDAIALDERFRKEFIEYAAIEGRSKKLNDELVRLLTAEKTQIITDLFRKAGQYK